MGVDSLWGGAADTLLAGWVDSLSGGGVDSLTGGSGELEPVRSVDYPSSGVASLTVVCPEGNVWSAVVVAVVADWVLVVEARRRVRAACGWRQPYLPGRAIGGPPRRRQAPQWTNFCRGAGVLERGPR